jgi:hypothetical protein
MVQAAMVMAVVAAEDSAQAASLEEVAWVAARAKAKANLAVAEEEGTVVVTDPEAMVMAVVAGEDLALAEHGAVETEGAAADERVVQLKSGIKKP